jgi:fucose permease
MQRSRQFNFGAVMSLFFFSYVGTEHAFGIYLSAFAHKSALAMPAVSAATVTSGARFTNF